MKTSGVLVGFGVAGPKVPLGMTGYKDGYGISDIACVSAVLENESGGPGAAAVMISGPSDGSGYGAYGLISGAVATAGDVDGICSGVCSMLT